MKRKLLLRRSSEALAAVVIVISVVLYSFAIVSRVAEEEEPASVVLNENEAVQAADANAPLKALAEETPDTYQDTTADTSDTTAIADNNLQQPNTGEEVSQMALNHPETPGSEADVQPAGGDTPVSADAPVATTAPEADEKADPVEPVQQPVYRYVQLDSINVRSGASSDTEKLGTLTKGNRVQVLQQVQDWLEVLTPDNIKGYVFAEYTADSLPPVYKYVSADTVNLRSGAGSDTEKLGTLGKGSRLQVLETLDKWLKVITSDNVNGYVYAEYVSDKMPVIYNYVNTSTLNVRKGPGSDTTKLATLNSGDKVQFLESKGEWTRIKTSKNVEGYVYSKYISKAPTAASRSESGSGTQSYNSDLATQVLEYAKQYVGVKYVYGGESPKGFDCSGFTQYVFAHFKIKLPRSASEYSSVGTKISRSDMKPGDLLLFDRYDDWTLGHVGIYMGNDKFIHASSRKGKVVIATLSKYSGNILGIRRVLK